MPARFVILITAVFAVGLWGAAIGMVGPFLPDIAAAFSVRLDIAGAMITAGNLGSLLLAPLTGFLADRYGKKRLFLFSGVLAGLGYALIALGPSFLAVVGAWVLGAGLGASLCNIAVAIVSDLDPRRVMRNVNLVQACLCLGAAAALGLTAPIIGADGAWRMAFLWLALCAGSILLLGLFMPVPPATSHERMNLAAAKSLLQSRPIQLLALAIGLYVGVEISIATWTRTLLTEMYHTPAQAGTLASGLFWLAMGIGRLTVGALTRRLSAVAMLKTLISCGGGAFLLLLLPFAWTYWLGVALAGLSFSGIWPLLVALGCLHHPRYSGSVVGLLAATSTLGGAIVPFLIGLVIAQAAMWWGVLAMTACYALVALAILIYIRQGAATSVETPVAVE